MTLEQRNGTETSQGSEQVGGQSNATGQPTPEQLEAYLKGLSHDQLSQIPAYNGQVSRGLEKARAEAKAEADQRSQISQWTDWFGSLDADQFRTAMKNPEYVEMYNRVQRVTNPSAITAEQVATNTVTRLRERLVKDDRFSDLDWVQAPKDPADFITHVIEYGSEKERKAMREELKKFKEVDLQATLNDWAARHGLQSQEPETPQGDQVGGPGTRLTGLPSFQEYQRMDPDQAAKLTSAQIQSITDHYLEGQERSGR